jgi:hypothetical protein
MQQPGPSMLAESTMKSELPSVYDETGVELTLLR